MKTRPFRSDNRSAKHPRDPETFLRVVLIGLTGVWLYLFLLHPMGGILLRSLKGRSGAFVGLSNYAAYFSSGATAASLTHSLYVSAMSAIITVGLAFVFAYSLTRTTVPGNKLLKAVAMMPIFTPSLVHALAFIYIFGNNGLFTRWSGINIGLYGPVGIIMAEVFYAFPHALVILVAALQIADARLYEAAEALGASPLRVFRTVTLPSVKYGLVSAVFVVFTLAMTDFGAPKVLGGNYDVLATDIYNKVVGQQNFEMGATVSALLLLPAVIAFGIDRLMQRRQSAHLAASVVPLQPKRHHPLLHWGLVAYCGGVAAFMALVYGVVVAGAFVTNWPHNFSPTLRNFQFYTVGGYAVLWNSLWLAFLTAVFGTSIVFCSAYLIEKGRGAHWARSTLYLLSVVPLAVPGMVLGLSYVFTFNNPANPLNFLYGTTAILVISTIIHYYTVPFFTATTALKQLAPEFEVIGESLKSPFYRTFWRVTVPIALPTVLSIAMYFFLNAMVTLSAVVFLFVPGKELASLAVMLLDDTGESAQALAMSLLIIVAGLTARGVFFLMTRRVERRAQAWRKR